MMDVIRNPENNRFFFTLQQKITNEGASQAFLGRKLPILGENKVLQPAKSHLSPDRSSFLGEIFTAAWNPGEKRSTDKRF